jgi:hypothetical protein
LGDDVAKEKKRAFLGVWIPAALWLDERLSWMEKLMLCEIASLDSIDECFASNSHFAKMFHLSRQRVSQIILGLQEKGDIKIQYIRDGKKVEKRVMSLDRGIKYFGQGIKNIGQGYQEYLEERITKRDKQERNKETSGVSAPPSGNGELRKALTDSFKYFNERRGIDISSEWNWNIQGKHLSMLIKKIEKQDDPMSFANELLTTYASLIEGNDKFWKAQPFTIQNLNSEGIYSRVREEMENGHRKALTPEQAEWIRGLWK